MIKITSVVATIFLTAGAAAPQVRKPRAASAPETIRQALPLRRVVLYSNFVSRHYLDEESRKALESILDLKGKIASLDATAAALDGEAGEIASDQQRLRENVKVLKDTSEARQLIARYVAKAGEQETRLERLREERKSIIAERGRLQAELETAIRALSVERKLATQ